MQVIDLVFHDGPSWEIFQRVFRDFCQPLVELNLSKNIRIFNWSEFLRLAILEKKGTFFYLVTLSVYLSRFIVIMIFHNYLFLNAIIFSDQNSLNKISDSEFIEPSYPNYPLKR